MSDLNHRPLPEQAAPGQVEEFRFELDLNGANVATSFAWCERGPDTPLPLALVACTIGTARSPGQASSSSSVTRFGAEGTVMGFRSETSDGRTLAYRFDALGRRWLTTDSGEPVLIDGPVVHAVIEHNNFAALLLLMRHAVQRLRPGDGTTYAVLIPELNRTLGLRLEKEADTLTCPALGLRYRWPGPGQSECLELMAQGASLSLKPLAGDDRTQMMRWRDRLCAPATVDAVAEPGIRFRDELADADALLATGAPLTGLRTPAQGRSRGLFVLIGGSGEYDARGFTRLGENLGYLPWIRFFSREGYDVLSVARRSDAPVTHLDHRRALLALIERHRAKSGPALVIAGHSLGGLVAADIAPALHPLPVVILAACPARGLRKTILRQAFCQVAGPREPQMRDRAAWRSQADHYERFISGPADSPAIALRQADRALIRAFSDVGAAELLRRWPTGGRVLVMHADADEKVDFRDAGRWIGAAARNGVKADLLPVPGKDHVFGLMDAAADPEAVLAPVAAFLRTLVSDEGRSS